MQHVINEQNRKTDILNDELKKSKIQSDTTLNEQKSLLYQKSSQLETALEAASKLGLYFFSTKSKFFRKRYLDFYFENFQIHVSRFKKIFFDK